MKMAPHLALDTSNGAIGEFPFSHSVQGHYHGEPAPVVSNNPDGGYGFATWPLSHSVEAGFSQIGISYR